MEMEKEVFQFKSKKIDEIQILKEDHEDLKINASRYRGTTMDGTVQYWVEVHFKLELPTRIASELGKQAIEKEVVVICDKEDETLQVINDLVAL